MFKNAYMWAGAVVLAIAVGVFFLRDSGGKGAAPEQEEDVSANGTQVIYTDAGFTPRNLSVKAGDAVIFRNQSSGVMWVASDDHPAHAIYPEFDAKKAHASGDRYVFTFGKAGTWGYHNHRTPAHGGAITVR